MHPEVGMSGTRSTRRRFARVAGVGALALVAAFAGGVVPASGDELLVENFRGTAVVDASAWVSGGAGGSVACLTAGTNAAQTPIPGCALGTPDADGSGVLRLTPAFTGRGGFALFNQAKPSTAGLDVTFQQSQWGGNGADGIAFILVDGSSNLTTIGNLGGALGYTGLANALLAVGLDAFGNFSTASGAQAGCLPGTGPGSAGPGQIPNTVAIRGPGNAGTGYCWLGGSSNLTSFGITLSQATRAAGEVTVRIVIDPSDAPTRNVSVYLNGQLVLSVPAPQQLLDATSFKFGFTAATGALTNNHEVWDLSIDTVVPLPPVEPVVVEPVFTG
jgi:hypothetical protein